MSDDKQEIGETFSAEEEKQAQRLAEHVDNLLQGEAIPPVMVAEERDLLMLSSLVHANFGDAPLTSDKQSSILDAAMAQAISVEKALLEENSDSVNIADEIGALRKKRTRSWPIVLGLGIAAAAALLFYSRTSPPESKEVTASIIVRQLPESERSRSSDELVGQIERGQSNRANLRIDQIVGDRMMGYRNLHYRHTVGSK